MKTVEFKTPKVLLLIVVTAFLTVLSACTPPCDDCKPSRTLHVPESFTAGAEGGTFQTLKGNVTLIIPESALAENVKFTIKEGPVDYSDEFVIKSIEVNPTHTLFREPVGISLKYNGQLSCGIDPCSAKSLVLYKFKNDMAFDKRIPSDMVWINKCQLNVMDQCLETEILSGGVFAIGEESLSKTNN